MTEAEACRRYVDAAKSLDEAEGELQTIFTTLIDEQIRLGKFDEAQAILNRCPDCVSKVFLMDHIRVARWDANGELCQHRQKRDTCSVCRVS